VSALVIPIVDNRNRKHWTKGSQKALVLGSDTNSISNQIFHSIRSITVCSHTPTPTIITINSMSLKAGHLDHLKITIDQI
jgi:hypothetical protein